MAKKKDEQEGKVSDGDELSSYDLILKQITKDYGQGIIVPPTSIMDDVPEIISVSPYWDMGLNGGIPLGVWVTLAGLPKDGKTTSALHIAKKAQQQYGMHVYYGNVEHRLKRMNIEALKFDPELFTIIQSTEEKILTIADHLTIYEHILRNSRRSVLIIDSYSLLSEAKEQVEGVTAQSRGSDKKMLSSFCRTMAPVVPLKKHLVIGINHMIANTSGFGAPLNEKGGYAVRFQADVHLRCKSKYWRTGSSEDAGEAIGKNVEWEVLCSALGAPGTKFTSKLRFGTGIDETQELIELATQYQIIKKAGSHYTVGDNKYHGSEALYFGLKDDVETIASLRAQLKELAA